VIGTIVMIVILVLAPVGIIASSILGSFLIGLLVNDEVDARHDGTELLELSKSQF